MNLSREKTGFVLVTLVAVATALVMAAEPLLAGREWFFRDLLMHYLPLKELQAALLQQGALPWWDPWHNGGQPLLASPNTGSLHPVVLAYMLLPSRIALAVTVIACSAVAMISVDRLARRLGLGAQEGLLAALAFGTSGLLASCVNLQPLFLALCAVPPLLWQLDAFVFSRSPRALGFAMLCGAWIALAGTLEGALVAAATGIAWIAVVRPGEATLARRAGALLALMAGIVALAAVQVLPALHVLAGSRRAAGLGAGWILGWSVSPRRLPELIVPGFIGRTDVIDASSMWASGIESPAFPYMLSLHLGALPLLLAVAGAFGRGDDGAPRRLRLWLAALALAAVTLALGSHLPGAGSLDLALPIRFPVKAMLAVVLPVALLAALGLREMRERTAAGRAVAAAALVGAVMLGSMALACLAHPPAVDRVLTSWFRVAAPGASGALAIGLGLACAQAGVTAALPWITRRRFAVVAAHAVVAITGLHVFWSVNPAAPRGVLTGTPPAAEIALRELHGGRLYPDKGTEEFRLRAPSNDSYFQDRWLLASLAETYPARYGIPVILHDDFDGLVPTGLARLTDAVKAAPWPDRTRLLAASGASLVATTAVLPLDGLEPVAEIEVGSSVPLRLLAVKDAVAPVRFVSRAVAARDTSEAISLLLRPSHDARAAVVLTGSAPPASGPACEAAVTPSSLGDRAEWSGAVDAACDGFVVIALPEHAGTRITVDGMPASVLTADAAFMAVAVPKGRHVVSWRYRPRGFALGAAISGIALAAVLMLLGRRRDLIAQVAHVPTVQIVRDRRASG